MADEAYGGSVKMAGDSYGGSVKMADDAYGGTVKMSDDAYGGPVKMADDVYGGTVKMADDAYGGPANYLAASQASSYQASALTTYPGLCNTGYHHRAMHSTDGLHEGPSRQRPQTRTRDQGQEDDIAEPDHRHDEWVNFRRQDSSLLEDTKNQRTHGFHVFGWDPRISEMDPRISERNPRISERDPGPLKGTRRTSERDPRISERDPRTSERDPRTSERDPRNSDRDPRISERDPRISDSRQATDFSRHWPRKAEARHRDTRSPILARTVNHRQQPGNDSLASGEQPRGLETEERAHSRLTEDQRDDWLSRFPAGTRCAIPTTNFCYSKV